jgi:hypothetical protein
VTNATTASALWPLSRVAPGLGGNDLPLEACQHPLPVSHGQTQIGDIVEIIRPVLNALTAGALSPMESGRKADRQPSPIRRRHEACQKEALDETAQLAGIPGNG